MNRLLIKRELDASVTKAQFLEDVDCLFDTLRSAYGMYEYYGEERFRAAREELAAWLNGEEFEFSRAVSRLKGVLSAFIRDGHFTIGEQPSERAAYAYAVRRLKWHGLDVIDCKKFWYDTEEERRQLEEFAAGAGEYRNDAPLVIDLRDNPGGSDVYIWEFIKGLFGVEPGYACKYVQKHSELFREALAAMGITDAPDLDRAVVVREDREIPIHSRKPIYVLFNERTCSSGESAIAYLRTVTGAVLVGDRSGGCFTCGNCIRIWLPNSHLPVYFGTGMVLYEGTRNLDVEGGFLGDISLEQWLGRMGLPGAFW